MAKGSKIMTGERRPSVEKQVDESDNEEDSFSEKQIGITVTVEWIENLDVCKVKEITLKMEFKGNTLAMSDSIPVKKNKVDIDLRGTIVVDDDVDLQFLDDMLSNPVLFTVINSGASAVFPSSPSPKLEKEPKKKTAKVSESPVTAMKPSMDSQNILGICNLDISGLILGKKTVRERLPVDSEKKVPPMEVVPWVKLPKLWVNATTEDWDLFDEAAKKMNNILGITIESIYNIPEYISDGTVFEANVPAPSLGNRSNMVTFPGGVVTVPKEANTWKRWLNLPQFEGSGARTQHCVCPTSYDVINTLEGNYDLQKYVRKLSRILQWNMWRRSLMVKSDYNYFYSKLIKYHVWPVEICSDSKPKEPAQKSAKSDKKTKPAPSATNTSRDHFIAFINLSALLYPGVTKARVAAQLCTYSYSDLVMKFGSDHPGLISQASVGTIKSKAPSVKSKTSFRVPEENKDNCGALVFAEDGSPVFIIVEVELLEPLTPKYNPEKLIQTLKDHVSLKGEPRKKIITATSTEENFSRSVKDMVSMLTEEYEKFCQEVNKNSQKANGLNASFEEFLCRRENFYKMQVTLENKVMELIHKKFGPTSLCEELPNIYIYLVEKMYKITNQCLLNQDESSGIFNIDDYQLYAEEALEEGEFGLARDYLFLKLSHQITNPDYWLDCAVYFNIFDQTEKAIEAVREALYLNFNHQIGLLMYALLMQKIRDRNVAELAFQVLLTKYPDYLEGWLAFWLYYSTTGNTSGGFVALQMANKLNYELSSCAQKEENCQEEKHESMMEEEDEEENEEDEEKKTETESCGYLKTYPPENKYLTGYNKNGIGSFRNGQTTWEPLAWTSQFSPPNSIHIRMAVFMMRLGFYEHSSMCLMQNLYLCTSSENKILHCHYYEAVNNYLLGRYYDAIPHLQNFVKSYGKDCFVWGLMGHCYYKLQNHAQAIACYEYVIESYNRPDDIHLIYLRMGYYYLKAKKYPCAKKVLLTACKYSPSPKLWKGIGVACLRMKEVEEAETAFSEANYLDNKDPEIWAYLALTNALLGRLNLFKNCYMEAKRRNLQNQELIYEVETCALLNGLEDEEFNFFK